MTDKKNATGGQPVARQNATFAGAGSGSNHNTDGQGKQPGALLSRLWQGGSHGFYWTSEGRRSLWVDPDKLPPIPAQWSNQNVYFGVHPCIDIPPTNSKGEKTAKEFVRSQIDYIAAVNCFFAEFDAKDFEGGKPAILAHLDTFPQDKGWPYPSVIVDSGGGYHCYFLLEHTVTVNDENRAHLARVQAAWVGLVGGDNGAKDLSRVLRIPGTRNFKEKYAPDFPTVAIIEANFQRLFALRDFEELTEHLRSGPAPTPAQATGNGYGDNYVTEEYIRAAFDGELDQLARAAQGGRNDALNAAAHNLGTLVADGLLMEGEVISALETTALAIGLESGEIAATILSGLQAGKAKPRGLRLRPTLHANGNGAGYAAMFGAQGGELPDGDGSTPLKSGTDTRHQWPYTTQNRDQMFFCREREKDGDTEILYTPIADFRASIVGVIADEDGNETYQIEGQATRQGYFRCEIPAFDFGDNRKLIAILSAAAGPKDPIHAGQNNHIGPAIKKLTQGDLIETRRFSRTGWADGRFLIPGRESEGVTLNLHRKLPFAIPGTGDLAKGLAGLEALLQSMGAEMGTVLLSALFSGPMARLAGWQGERYAVFVRGRTGTLKTSNTQAAMSIYGPGFLQDDALTKWGDGATANALMALATQAHDLPFLIDNYKPNTGGGAHAFVGLIHNILEGGEKDRLTRSATLRDTRPIFCWPICTGEDVPDGDAASLARVLVIPFSEDNRLPERKAALSIAQQAGAAGHLAAVGGAWLDWLESEEGKAAAKRRGAQLVDRRNLWADGLEKLNPRMANPLRVATNLATNDLAWKTLAEHPFFWALAGRYADSHLAGLKTIAAAMAEQTTESSEGERFIYALRELLSTEQAVLMDADESADSGNPFPDPRETSRRIGWIAEDGGAYLLPKSTRAAVERLAGNLFMSDQALYDQLDSLGYIGRKDKDRRTLTKRIGGKVQKVLHIQAGALAGDGAA